jgi:predicted transposase/invertase (TIGR01784 family)
VRDAGDKIASGGQTYGIATFDALFKYILGDPINRASFLHAFLSKAGIIESYRLDEHMNPLQELQRLREFVHRQDTEKTVGSISSDCIVYCPCSSRHKSQGFKLAKATDFLHEMVGHFEDIKKAFPKAKYNGTMDFVCKLDNGEFSLVEMQVLPKDNWDERALAYAAAFYSRQIGKGQHWPDIKKVYAINILGGGTRQQAHWAETTDQYMRHYKFQEQLHKESCERFIDGIELIQCSVMNALDALSSEDQERRDWITFFKRAALMNEDQVKSEIRTPAVLNAFKMARLSHLPKAVKCDYDAENELYNQVSQHTAARVAAGRAEGKAEGLFEAARNMKLSKSFSNSEIASFVGLEESVVSAIKIK